MESNCTITIISNLRHEKCHRCSPYLACCLEGSTLEITQRFIRVCIQALYYLIFPVKMLSSLNWNIYLSPHLGRSYYICGIFWAWNLSLYLSLPLHLGHHWNTIIVHGACNLKQNMEILREKCRVGPQKWIRRQATIRSQKQEKHVDNQDVLGQARMAISEIVQEGMQVLHQVLGYRAPGKHDCRPKPH